MVPAPNIQTILYASDLGDNTRPVFRLAVSQARRYNARLIMLHVVEPLGISGTSAVARYVSAETAAKINNDGAREMLEVMKQRLEKFCQEEIAAYGLDRTPVTEVAVATGDPSEEIINAVKHFNADMIIMGKPTRTLLGSVIMGTTARRVARHADVPVLLVPNTKKG